MSFRSDLRRAIGRLGSKAAVGRALGRNSSLVSQWDRGVKGAGAEFQRAVGRLARGQSATPPARRTTSAGDPASVRQPTWRGAGGDRADLTVTTRSSGATALQRLEGAQAGQRASVSVFTPGKGGQPGAWRTISPAGGWDPKGLAKEIRDGRGRRDPWGTLGGRARQAKRRGSPDIGQFTQVHISIHQQAA